jgi:hypothetical protein
VITPNQGNTQVNTELFTTTDDRSATLFAAPAYVTANYGTIGTNPIVTYTATDPSKNVATCLSQMKIAGILNWFFLFVFAPICFIHFGHISVASPPNWLSLITNQ